MSLLKNLLEILTPAQRRSALLLLGLMLVGMVLETLSIGLALPALTLLTRDQTELSPTTTHFLELLGNPSNEQLVMWGMLGLIGIFAVKTLFLGYLAWKQARFVFDLQADIAQRLFTLYVRQPYPFHLQRNSSELIANVVTETNLFTSTGLLAAMIFLTEILVLVGICVLLFYLQPLGALLVGGTLAAAGLGFFQITRARLLRWGEARQRHEQRRIQHLQQALGGIKDVKLLGREADFLSLFSRDNVGTALANQRQIALGQLPRLWIELLAVIGLAVLTAVIMAEGQPIAALLPTIGLFAAAAFRLMPSANRVMVAIQHMRFAMPVANRLHAELNLPSVDTAPHTHSLPFERALALHDVRFKYSPESNDTLAGVNVSIVRGTSVGFIGESGAGKSTLVDVVLGLLTPSAGNVTVDDVDIQTNLRGWQSQIGYVTQTIFLTDDSLRRNVAFGIRDEEIDDRRVWQALRSAQLDDFVRSLPEGLETQVGERGVRLSGGQRQRIGIARALYHDPAVLVLDEATSALDVATERGVMDAVQELHGSKTIFIVAHRHSTIERCDRVFRIEKGKIVEEGKAGDLLQSQRSLAMKYKSPA